RTDGVAENFHTEQNRQLLEKLAAETGGRYWRPQELSRLSSEIPYSAAGITLRETKDLWNMPAVFLLMLGLRSSEWLLRRKWGILCAAAPWACVLRPWRCPWSPHVPLPTM